MTDKKTKGQINNSPAKKKETLTVDMWLIVNKTCTIKIA
jgi:hypothetical protein